MTDKRMTDEEVERLAREQAREMPPEVGERLAAMRRAAVAQLDETSWRDRLGDWFRSPAAVSLVGVSMAIALAVWLVVRPDNTLMEIPLVSEPEVAIVQDMELLEELEFLAWLEEESPGAG